MAQSGYLFLEDGKWKVRYRIKDETGKWRWAPVSCPRNEAGLPQAKRCQGRQGRVYGESEQDRFPPCDGMHN